MTIMRKTIFFLIYNRTTHAYSNLNQYQKEKQKMDQYRMKTLCKASDANTILKSKQYTPKSKISKLRATIAKQQNKLETFQHKQSFSFVCFIENSTYCNSDTKASCPRLIS